MTKDFLLELFSEEIPARMQEAASGALAQAVVLGLKAEGFAVEDSACETFVTPRRLALRISGLAEAREAVSTEIKGPRANAPEAALEGFLKKNNLTRAQLEERDGVFFANVESAGAATRDVLQAIIEKFLPHFPWPKSMRWGAGEARWVRPLHSILCLFGSDVVKVEFAGVEAGRVTYGHRFLAPQAIEISNPRDYEARLSDAFVIANRDERRAEVLRQANAEAARLGLTLREDIGLLEEVTGLVEWPQVLSGRIDDNYMDLPPEVLVSEMRGHQKYFALNQPDGSLSPHFLITANTRVKDVQTIIAGNERVLRARLADGRFFWDQDRKKTLDAWGEGLSSVTYHAKLGTIAQKVARVTALAENLSQYVPGAEQSKVKRAALLAKADLVTGMVGEFPELQGVMGRYYALHQGEDASVADAIRDHYKPLGPSDATPREPVSVCVALADKLDTLAQMFAIGEKPTGSKDPFALRRAALGIIRIVLENELRISLKEIINEMKISTAMLIGEVALKKPLAIIAEAQKIQGKSEPFGLVHRTTDNMNNVGEVFPFFLDRLKVQLKEQNIRHDITDAVTAQGDDDLVRVVARIKALQKLVESEDGANLLAAYKRAANILAIEEKKDKTRYEAEALNPGLFVHEQERALSHGLSEKADECAALVKDEKFEDAMRALAGLRASVDNFFLHVLVNDENPTIRANRLSLLAQLRATLDSVANFSLIEG